MRRGGRGGGGDGGGEDLPGRAKIVRARAPRDFLDLTRRDCCVPGVFGVLAALPKLANAPLPSPNAEDAPALVGDAREFEVEPMELNGLFDLLKLANRLVEGVSLLSRLSLLRSFLLTDRLSLLLL